MRRFFENLREKWDAWLDKIPRKTQVAINVLLILILPCLLYVFLGAPPLTPEHGFRRAEKENLVGPGRILGTEQIDGAWADTLIVAKTGHGVMLYTHNHKSLQPLDPLTYWERRGDIMVCGIPTMLSMLVPPEGDDLQMVVFDEHPEAVRAEVDAQLYWVDKWTGKEYRYDYSLSGNRTNPGYILVTCDIQWHNSTAIHEHPENSTIHQFTAHARDEGYHAPPGEFPATVRLYDEENDLICTEQIFLFPQA